MKKQLFKALTLMLTMGTLQANSVFSLAALAAGTRIGYTQGKEIKSNIAREQYGTALKQGITLAGCGLGLQAGALYCRAAIVPMEASIHPAMPIDPTIQKLATGYINATNTATKSIHLGSRIMMLTPLAMLGYEYLSPIVIKHGTQFCENSKQSLDMHKDIAVIAAKAMCNTVKNNVTNKFWGFYSSIMNDKTTDRHTLIGNK